MIKAYVINLDKNQDRWLSIHKRLDELEMDYERFSAIDGREFSDDIISEFKSRRPNNPHEWTKGGIGCFLSHYAVWQKIATGDNDYCVVFEDDVSLSDDVMDIVAKENWVPKKADIIRLEATQHRILLDKSDNAPIGVRRINKIIPSHNARFWAFGAAAYILSKKAAKILVDLPETMHCNADYFLFNSGFSQVHSKLEIYQISPAPAIQEQFLEDGNHAPVSDIQDELWKKESKNDISFWSKIILKIESLIYLLRGYRKVDFKISK